MEEERQEMTLEDALREKATDLINSLGGYHLSELQRVPIKRLLLLFGIA